MRKKHTADERLEKSERYLKIGTRNGTNICNYQICCFGLLTTSGIRIASPNLRLKDRKSNYFLFFLLFSPLMQNITNCKSSSCIIILRKFDVTSVFYRFDIKQHERIPAQYSRFHQINC